MLFDNMAIAVMMRYVRILRICVGQHLHVPCDKRAQPGAYDTEKRREPVPDEDQHRATPWQEESNELVDLVEIILRLNVVTLRL